MKKEYKCIMPNIFAIQYNGKNEDEIVKFCEGKALICVSRLYIKTSGGNIYCNNNDFIIKNTVTDFNFYPVAEHIFKKSYEIITTE